MVRQGDDIFVNRALFEQVVEALCLTDSDRQQTGEAGGQLSHEERQQALLELHAAGGLRHFDWNRLIKLATSAAFYRVCEVAYQHCGKFEPEIISCYWRDPARKHLTFNYVQSLVADRTIVSSEEDLDRLRTAVVGAVWQLVKIDARRTAKLLLVTLGVSLVEVIEHLNSDDEALYSLLSGVFEYINKSSTDNIQSSLPPTVYERYVDVMCQLGHPPMQVLVTIFISVEIHRMLHQKI